MYLKKNYLIFVADKGHTFQTRIWASAERSGGFHGANSAWKFPPTGWVPFWIVPLIMFNSFISREYLTGEKWIPKIGTCTETRVDGWFGWGTLIFKNKRNQSSKKYPTQLMARIIL